MKPRLSERKIVLVTRATRLAELERRFNTHSQAKFYVAHLGQDFSDYEHEAEVYAAAAATARGVLAELGRLQDVDRSFLPNFLFGEEDVIVVLGQDGLVANTVKYTSGQTVIGVNPDPARWDGQLLPFRVENLASVAADVLLGRRATTRVSMAMASLNTGERLYAVNDLFVGPRSHVSARYRISIGDRAEEQSSSGLIVSTGVGSTGWLASLVAGAAALAGQPAESARFPWDADYLRFTVREPFPSRTTGTSIVSGQIDDAAPLKLESRMPEHGVIFSDGIESDFLEFRSGSLATIELADRHGTLAV